MYNYGKNVDFLDNKIMIWITLGDIAHSLVNGHCLGTLQLNTELGFFSCKQQTPTLINLKRWWWRWWWWCSVVSDSATPWIYSPWNPPGQNTGVGSLSLLQGIFPTQGLDSGLPLCGQILYELSHKGSPRVLEWVAYPFSRGSSWPRNRTGVCCIPGGFFTNWAMREVQLKPQSILNCFSHVWLFAAPCTVVCQAPLSMGFSRQEYWRWVSMPSSRGSSQPRTWTYISCGSCIAGRFFTTEPPGKPHNGRIVCVCLVHSSSLEWMAERAGTRI